MKLVIDIPEEEYEYLKAHHSHEIFYGEAIANGTPLPEPCEDCVSREAVINMIQTKFPMTMGLIEPIKDLPSVNPERVKGKWIIDDDKDEWYTYVHTCPFCDYEQVGGNFCTNCGAELKEEI